MRSKAFTIVELLVVMSIMTILGGIVTNYIVKIGRQNSQIEATAIGQKDLNLAIDRLDRVIRSSTLLLSTTDMSLRVRAYANTGDAAPSEIYFYVDSASNFKYQVIPPSGSPPSYTYDASHAVTYTLLTNLQNSSPSNPLFKYYNDNNTLLVSPVSQTDVTAIEVDPSILDTKKFLKKPLSVTTLVSLRNLKTNL